MPLPTQTDAFYITLEMFSDGLPHTRKEIFNKAVDTVSLSDEETKERTKSGTPIYESRLGWGISYLERAGMLKKVRRGVYEITPRGEQALQDGVDGKEFLYKLNAIIDEENPWNIGADTKKEPTNPAQGETRHDERSPQEAIEQAISSLNDSLASELLSMILDHDPYVFEEIVVKLLEVMGYGVGEVTSKSNDGGIDGIITADPLGFEAIYTQAKRYNPSNKVGAPEIQGFIGALRNANKGVFITTSSFQPAAIEVANSCLYAKIKLIDGEELINLMIKYNVGVTVEDTYEIKRIDLDFFDELS
ncbi:restriction endonuclease [Adlercreutzia sp. R21]|uniref:restriction endonuclease n=1 Tax=Adlercreutzia wanghongyangiae TaxID=3111451 RepID=UPI002DC04630|nr:restriction endonuclease [Adlercreutzia sp. R21]MEC4183308.1 restriction endonuclease [Adlercreutzia sp. R21]